MFFLYYGCFIVFVFHQKSHILATIDVFLMENKQIQKKQIKTFILQQINHNKTNTKGYRPNTFQNIGFIVFILYYEGFIFFVCFLARKAMVFAKLLYFLHIYWSWRPEAPQTLRIYWFGAFKLHKRYAHNGLAHSSSQNVTYTMVWRIQAPETLRI